MLKDLELSILNCLGFQICILDFNLEPKLHQPC
jgi:hypothetical protein